MEEHASSHEEDVCIGENQKTMYDTSSELTDEVDDTGALDGYTFDESTKDEDATYDDDHMFQSIYDEEPTSFTVHDAYGEGSPSVIALTRDEDSTPYVIYDANDDEEMIVPQQSLEDQLLVKEEQIVQVLTRADGTHKLIKDLMWKAQMEERQKGVADGITSAQLNNIK